MIFVWFLCLAFREVFNLFDINGGGTIDADELDSALRTVDIQLEQNEIRDVLQVLDEDGKMVMIIDSCCRFTCSDTSSLDQPPFI